MRVCSVHGCPIVYPTVEGSRCSTHRTEARQARRPTNDVYSSRGHIRFRVAVLQRDPICVLCRVAFSTAADHYPLDRKELTVRSMDPNAPEHGRGLCARCHNRETAAHQPGGWNARD